MATVDANFWSMLSDGDATITRATQSSTLLPSLWNDNVSGATSNATSAAADAHVVPNGAGQVSNVPSTHTTAAADADQKFLLDLQQALKSVLSEPQPSTSGPLANPFVVTSADTSTTTNSVSAFHVSAPTRCASAPTVIHASSIAGTLPKYSATHAIPTTHVGPQHSSPPHLHHELRFPSVQAPVSMIPVMFAGSNQVVMVPTAAFMQHPTFPAVPSQPQGTTPHSTPTTGTTPTMGLFMGTSSSPVSVSATAAAAISALPSSSLLHFQTTGRASKKGGTSGGRGSGTSAQRHSGPAATPPSSSSSTPQSLLPNFPMSPASLPMAPSSSASSPGGAAVVQMVQMPAPPSTQSFASSTTSIASLSGKSAGGGSKSTTTPPSNAAIAVARDHGNRPNHGTNVHDQLAGVCAFHPYRVGGQQQRRVPPLPASAVVQTLPVFVQMFPSEWVSESHSIFQDLITLVCGSGAGIVEQVEPRSETSFIAHVKTAKVWDVIAGLRCRVLMDRHGFWYASDWNCYVAMKEYCESVRRLPQQLRHYKTDGLPCMPLVVELGRMVAQESVLAPPSSSLPFDALLPVMGGGGAGDASPGQPHGAATGTGGHHSSTRSRGSRQSNSARQGNSSGGASTKLTMRGGHRGTNGQAVSLF